MSWVPECTRLSVSVGSVGSGSAGGLDQAAVEEECGGKFIDLRKAFFLLTGAEAPLVAKVGYYT